MLEEKGYTFTAYDDAFRTIETECDDALIHFVNHVFNENYDKTAKVIRLRNEHFLKHEVKADEKCITDSHFKINCRGTEKEYHLECESSGYSKTILIRIFQYGVSMADNAHDSKRTKIVIRIPHSGLLILRDVGSPPEKVLYEIQTPGGSVSYDVPVICESDYTIDEIFEKELYFLIPFYFFNFEEKIDQYDSDPEKLKEFEEMYCDIIDRIHQLNENELSLRSKGVIIQQMGCVVKKLAEKREKVTEKVGDIMGGHVVKMEWLERFDAAVAGGEARGEDNKLIRLVCIKLRKGMQIPQIARELEEDEIRIKVICDMAKEFAPDYDENKVIEAVHLQELA